MNYLIKFKKKSVVKIRRKEKLKKMKKVLRGAI